MLQVFVVRMGKSKFAAAPVFLLFFRGYSRFLRQLAACVLGDYFSFPPISAWEKKRKEKHWFEKWGNEIFPLSEFFFWEATRVV